MAAGQPNSLAQTQDVQTAVLTGTAYQLVDQTIIDGVVVQETEVPVVGGRVVIPELSIDMPLNSDGSFALTDLSVTTDSEDPTNVTVTFSSPGLGDYTYAHVRLYPGTVGPNLTPQLVKAPRINDRSDAYPDSDVAPPPNNLALGSAASGGLCTPSRERLVLPPTIRVWENGPGQDGLVHSIDFKSYVKHVLPSEWIASWPAESLRAGAMAVKSFGWWHATHAYNKPNPLGTCYDVDATVNFQVFDPDYDHPNTNAAVDATWSYYMILDSGLQSDVVHAFYKSGYSSDACGDWFGPGAPGNDMSQWGSKSCADGGMPWYYILPTYYFPPSVSWILRYSGDDSDGDRCPNGSEVGTTEGTGGRRNLHNPWDYMNPTHDGLNRMDDILMVQGQYFKDDNDGNPGLPPYAPGYNPDTDRTGIGPRDWDLGAPNGQQRTDDILNMTKQYFHDCHV